VGGAPRAARSTPPSSPSCTAPLLRAAAAQVDRARDLRQGLHLPAARRFSGHLDDLLATLTRFVAEAIARSYREGLPAPPQEIYVSGGGALNPTLMAHLTELLAPAPVATTAALGFDPRPRRPSRSPSWPTRRCSAPRQRSVRHRARGPRVLGKISL
jgi:hypothetical protein